MATTILEAIVARARILLPAATDVWLESDNARTYQNDVTPVIAPFIGRAYSFVLKGFLHPETTRDKSLVDTHFVVSMR